VRGGDNGLWAEGTNGGVNWVWISLGGQIPAGTLPAACSWGGRVDVFVKGMDGARYHKLYTGTWSGWAPIGGI
jgi:hypothetical protein